MATPTVFARRIEALGRLVPRRAADILRDGALGIQRDLVLQTPVDEGRARSNWLAGVNLPRRDTGPAVSSAGAIAQAAAVLAGVRADDVVFLSNNLPYINALAEGRSPQAPAGYVDAIVRRGALRIKGARLLVQRGRVRGR